MEVDDAPFGMPVRAPWLPWLAIWSMAALFTRRSVSRDDAAARSLHEESWLARHLGAEYQAYRARVPALWPHPRRSA